MMTSTQARDCATRMRQLASHPSLKKMFSSFERKLLNDLANRVMEVAPSLDPIEGIEKK